MNDLLTVVDTVPRIVDLVHSSSCARKGRE